MILKFLENKGFINGLGKKVCKKKMKEIILN